MGAYGTNGTPYFFAAGNPELWTQAVEVLVTNATTLMEAIAELLKATEIAAVTKSEF